MRPAKVSPLLPLHKLFAVSVEQARAGTQRRIKDNLHHTCICCLINISKRTLARTLTHADESETHALLEEALAELEHTAEEHQRLEHDSAASRYALEKDIAELRWGFTQCVAYLYVNMHAIFRQCALHVYTQICTCAHWRLKSRS